MDIHDYLTRRERELKRRRRALKKMRETMSEEEYLKMLREGMEDEYM